MRSWEPNAIGSIVPPFGGGSGGGGGPVVPGQDKFAPRYLVGNVPAGDPAASTPGPFQYIADPGDGTGIAAALAAAALVGGDVWIRPGTYTLAEGVGPLAVPPGVTVKGSGETTVIVAAKGEQGIFVTSASFVPPGFPTLRDMVLIAGQGNGQGASTAMVRCIDSCTIQDVTMRLETSVSGQLREALRIESTGSPLPVSRLLNVRIAITTTGQEATPVAGIRTTAGAVVFARSVEILDASGGQVGYAYGLDLGEAAFFESLFIGGFTLAGVFAAGGGALGQVRVNEGLLVGSPNAVAGVANGIDLQSGNGHVLRSIYVISQGVLLNAGVRLANGGTNEIDDVEVYGYLYSIDLDTQFDTVVSDCAVQSPGTGIRIQNSGDCKINHNQVQSVDPTLPGLGAGIFADALSSGCIIDHNTVRWQANAQSPLPAAHGIHCLAQLSNIIGNNVVTQDAGVGIEVDAERVVSVGNVVQSFETPACIRVADDRVRCVVGQNNCTFSIAGTPAPLPAAIVYGGKQGSIGDNTIFMGTAAPPASGIVLTAASANSTCIGNVSEGSFGIPVTDLGVGNLHVGFNIGA